MSIECKTCFELKIEGGYFRVDKSQDPEYPGIDVEFVPDKHNGLSMPRILFEKPRDGKLRALIWNDPEQEDYTEEIEFE